MLKDKHITTEDRIIKAKIWLMTKEPWFGQLSCYLDLHENKNIPTMGVDIRGRLYYNPDFVDKLSDENIRFVLCHEILHLAFRHISRVEEREPKLWNIAADIKVNEEVTQNHDMQATKGALMPSYGTWHGPGVTVNSVGEKNAELIYAELKHKLKKEQQQVDQDLIYTGGSGQGDGKDSKGKDLKAMGIDPVSKDDIGRMERTWQSRVYSASQIAKGDTPAGIARELFKLDHPEIPWGRIINQRLRAMSYKHSWSKPSKRYLPWYFPGRVRAEGVKVVAAIDTSGSMSKEQLTKAISELYGLMTTFKFIDLWVTDCDAEVYDAKKVKKSDLTKLLLQGGGGTDFRPVFKWIKKDMRDNIDCLLFFTDLYGDFPDRKPQYDVFWVTDTPEGSMEIPFGRRLMVTT